VNNRVLTWAILLFQSFWLNVVIPGHTRGVVQLPGGRTVECCPFCKPISSGDSSDKPKPGPPATCAICFFAAHMSVPPAIDLSPGPLRFLHLLVAETARRVSYPKAFVPYDGRGPPFLV